LTITGSHSKRDPIILLTRVDLERNQIEAGYYYYYYEGITTLPVD
jgi:hypothetical protein